MHDRLHGTDFTADRIDRMLQALRRHKYLRKDGRFISGAGPLKLQIGPAVGNDAVMANWLHLTMPEQAARAWQMLRDKLVRIEADDVKIEATLLDTLDVGNYSRGDGMSRASLMCAANEFGDPELADAVEASLDKRYKVVRRNGAQAYAGISSWGNAAHVLARFTRENAIRDLLGGVVPNEWTTGPILAEAAYPDVLVARAVTDGSALDIVLRPGNSGGRTTLGIERLVPGRDYSVRGGVDETVTADADGRALVKIDLADRLEVTLRPTSLRSSTTAPASATTGPKL